jgi:hypothetical protein
MNLTEFIATNAITIDTEWKSRQLEDDREVDVWAVTLHMADRSIDLPFRMGQGLQGREPTPADVLECILSDAAGVENTNGFHDWLSEFVQDDEMMTTQKFKEYRATYDAIVTQAAELSEFLGDAYDTALWHLDQD